MATKSRRKRHRILALIAAGAMALVVALVVAVVWIMIRQPDKSDTAVPPTCGAAVGRAARPGEAAPGVPGRQLPRRAADVDPRHLGVVAATRPVQPDQFPIALLLNVTNPIREQFGTDRLEMYTVPYTAQFHNPLSADEQMSYNDSRAEGTQNAVKAMTDMNNRCPLTSYVLVGFSQGAVIAGDIASDIGNGRGPVDADLVLGVTLIADGRRQTGVGQDIGPNPPGQGAEITLHEVPMLSAMGLTMTGPRPGGFGVLNDRTNEICATGDLICSAPEEAFSITNLPRTMEILGGGAGQPVHAMYATTQFWNLGGQPATAWTLDWAQTGRR